MSDETTDTELGRLLREVMASLASGAELCIYRTLPPDDGVIVTRTDAGLNSEYAVHGALLAFERALNGRSH